MWRYRAAILFTQDALYCTKTMAEKIFMAPPALFAVLFVNAIFVTEIGPAVFHIARGKSLSALTAIHDFASENFYSGTLCSIYCFIKHEMQIFFYFIQ